MRKNERFLAAARLASVFLLGASSICLLALFYFVYYYGWTGERQFTSRIGVSLYYIFPALLAMLLFASLRLKPVYRMIVAICCLSLAGAAYGMEVFLQVSDFTPSVAQRQIMTFPATERKKIAARLRKQFGVEIDTRDRHEVIVDLRKQGIEAVPLVVNTAIKSDVMPLAGISNKVTVVCNQTGKYLTYASDGHGFHNPQGTWRSDHIDIAAVGNSFTLGACVPSDRNFVSLIRKRYPATLNLGMAGEGPLHMLAVLKEYAQFLMPQVVIWFYSEGATFGELQGEKQDRVLMRYLSADFSQGLLERQLDIDRALAGDVERQTVLEISRQAAMRESNAGLRDRWPEFIKLTALRRQPGIVYGTTTQEPEALSELQLSQLDADMSLFRDVLSAAKVRVGAWGGKLYFVYLPAWARYANYPEIGVHARTRILGVVADLGVPLIDIYPAFQVHGDALSLFPFRGPGQYSEEGHRLVAETVLDIMSNDHSNGSLKFANSLLAEMN